MSIDAELLLPPDIEIFAVRELAPQVRANIDATDEDFAISRLRSRAPTRIVDKESADLLESFRKPTRIVDAILAFASKRGLDAEGTLEQAYPLLHHLYEVKVLLPADRAQAIESEFEVGGEIEGFRLLRCVQVLDDNEVFLGRSAAGQFAAIKFYRKANERITQTLEREATTLRRIQRKRAPEVYWMQKIGSGVALATEWIFGSDALTAAAMIRRREAHSQQQLLSLCAEIAGAFADVHESGVLQGDVHPRNVLVDSRGRVRLIDFGLARPIDQVNESGLRGGVAFYFDPEFADAQRSHKSATLTPEGEQYSVASLLYQLWTGVYYLDWSMERDELLRQIVEDDPISFEARNLRAWPALEEALRRALHKRPERRFPSVRSFAEGLTALLSEAGSQDRNAALRRNARAREKDLLERALRRYALGGDALRDGIASAPLVSVNYGAAGIAYAIYRIARLRADPQLLALADVWAQKAYTLISHAQAFYDPKIEITRETVGEVSLFHSTSGLHCVRALVSIAMGDGRGANQGIQTFLARSRAPCENPDLTLGKGSLLLGCAELVEAMPSPWFVDSEPVRKRGDDIAQELTNLLHSGQMTSSTKITSLGIAHGWGGFMFALLRWALATKRNVDSAVVSALDELVALAEPQGGGIRWPLHNPTLPASYMEGWCNGTAGYALLYALAYSVLRMPRFAETSERAALSAWSAETQLGTLCCGLGGISYALLALYRLTGSEVWLERACMAARRAASDSSKYFLRDSLYKGAVGIAVLAEELNQPEIAAMPLFEPLPIEKPECVKRLVA